MTSRAAELRFATGIALRRPFQCLVQVTNRCNMKCGFCDFWPNGVASEQELKLEDFRAIAAQLATLGTFIVSIEGGEPFVRKDLVEIVRIFSQRHLPVLFTNGWYVDRAAARALFDAGLWQVGVSIDFPDAPRHDAKRGLAGALDRACAAIEHFKAEADEPAKQVHVMSIVMHDNAASLEALLAMSAARGVGHWMTLLSDKGFRRGLGQLLPPKVAAGELVALWRRYPHLHVFREYLERIDAYLGHEAMPACRAGRQSFNIDHLGNVAPCIEKSDRPFGNVTQEPLADIVSRMRELDSVARCQDCWTLCRGFSQVMGAGGSAGGWRDMALRMRSR